MTRLLVGAAASVLVLGRCARLDAPAGGAGWGRPRRRGRRWGTAVAGGLVSLASGELDLPLSFDDMDTDGDGIVDKAEFMTNARLRLDAEGEVDPARRQGVYRFAEGLFNFVEADGDGVLSEVELEYAWFCAARAALKADTEGQDMLKYRFKEDTVAQLRNLDEDDDGMVDAEEFWAGARRDLAPYGWSQRRFDQPHVQEEMRRIFNWGDMNGNGYIDNSEEWRLAGVLVYDYAVGVLARAIATRMDANRDSIVEWSEVAAYDMSNMDAVRDGFVAADLDHDGNLDAREVRRWAAALHRP